MRPVAAAGTDEGYLEGVNITWADAERGRGPTGTCIRTRTTTISRNIATDPRLAPWRAEALKRGYASSIALPLLVESEAIGALTIYAVEPDAWIESALLDESDPYVHLADFPGYLEAQGQAGDAYARREAWSRMAIFNVARAGRFSSDRTVREYARDVWGVEPA